MPTGPGSRRTSSRAKRDNLERWLLTYADLITLLLAFFVIMYGMSSADAKKFYKLASSMRKAFNVGVLEGDPSASILDQRMELSTSESSSDALGTEASDMEMILSEMGWIYQQEGLADKVDFSIRPEGIAITISGNLLFSSGRAELRPESVQLLHSLGRVLSKLPNSVRVEGHTDDVPPTGTEFPSNWELSAARAVAVVRYLSEVEGIEPRRLSAAAYSQYQAVAPNDSPRSRARNRRSEILILYPNARTSAAAQPSAGGVAGAPATGTEGRDASNAR